MVRFQLSDANYNLSTAARQDVMSIARFSLFIIPPPAFGVERALWFFYADILYREAAPSPMPARQGVVHYFQPAMRMANGRFVELRLEPHNFGQLVDVHRCRSSNVVGDGLDHAIPLAQFYKHQASFCFYSKRLAGPTLPF